MFYIEILLDFLHYIHLWLTIDTHFLLYLENTTIFIMVISRSVFGFIQIFTVVPENTV